MRRLLAVLVMIFAFGIISTHAKGVPDYYVLQGEDMFPMILHLDVALIFDPESRISPAPVVDTEPYILSSYMRIEMNEIYQLELSPVQYYPEAGIIFFPGAADRGIYQPYDYKWYVVNPEIAEILNAYIAAGREIYTVQAEMLPQLLRLFSS